MSVKLTKIASPLGALAILSLGVGVHSAVWSYAGRPALPDLDRLVIRFVMPLFLVSWLHADYPRSRYWPCFEYDLFIFAAWPVTLLHYLVHTRGARGLWVYVAFLVLFFFPAFCAGVAVLVAGVQGFVSQ